LTIKYSNAFVVIHLEYKDRTIVVEPYASLAFEKDNPSLVLEVAVTQQAKLVHKRRRTISSVLEDKLSL
jgi:hypothetical protein